ncbi:S8 family serine peptidase [Streptomyces sp. NPDC002867]
MVTTASAGNGPGDFRGGQPAGFPEVLTVTAKDVHNQPWRNSSFAVGPQEIEHTISAPGVDIFVQTLPNRLGCGADGRCAVSGTSLSAPIAAGVVALRISSGQCEGSSADIIRTVRGHAVSPCRSRTRAARIRRIPAWWVIRAPAACAAVAAPGWTRCVAGGATMERSGRLGAVVALQASALSDLLAARDAVEPVPLRVGGFTAWRC